MSVESELRRLATAGIAAFPPSGLAALAGECRRAAKGYGGIRFLPIVDAIEALIAAWAPYDAFWTDATEALNAILRVDLPLVLNEPDDAAALSLAKSMHEALDLIIFNAPAM